MKHEAQILKIMMYFDFDRVHKTMVALDWKWGDEVPDIYEVKDKALELLREVASRTEKNYTVSTGGLYARKTEYDLILEFVVEDWNEPLWDEEA